MRAAIPFIKPMLFTRHLPKAKEIKLAALNRVTDAIFLIRFSSPFRYDDGISFHPAPAVNFNFIISLIWSSFIPAILTAL